MALLEFAVILAVLLVGMVGAELYDRHRAP